ncbi:hypothetical protein PIB30_046639 [Stylosanthes scabra]|uniref:Secreted protein n=1 Tax=Stylosanthes scabra TaxID=79078 RepID=A0ABU6WJ96_9FABA|nr:hypothetical protein [Stylosanthes scabra]
MVWFLLSTSFSGVDCGLLLSAVPSLLSGISSSIFCSDHQHDASYPSRMVPTDGANVKLYGVAESYSREGVDVEVNSPRSPEIGLWDSRSNRVSRLRECVYLEGVMPPAYIVATS